MRSPSPLIFLGGVRGESVADAAVEIDVLVNCAGVAVRASTADTDEPAFDVTFQIDVKAPFFLVAALAPKIVARGGGSIINISTMVASYGQPGLVAYGARAPRSSCSPRRGPPNTGRRTSASTRSLLVRH